MAVACILGAGCAVTTIDVDVYKGPLVNDEDVQVSQTAAMVTGARPLLLDLRNRIEQAYRHTPQAIQAGFRPDIPDDVKSEFLKMPDHPDPKASSTAAGWWFGSPDAVRVNDILGLYEDTAPAEVRLLVEPLTQARQAYISNLETVVGRDVLGPGEVTPSANQPAIGITPAAERQMQVLAYEKLIKPTTTAPAAASPTHGKRPSEVLVEAPSTPEGQKDKSAVQKEQQALMQMWDASIALSQHVQDDAFQGLPRAGAVKTDVAQLVSQLTNPALLAVALYGLNAPADVAELRDELKPAVIQSLGNVIEHPDAARPWGAVSNALQTLLLVKPRETGLKLRETQDWFRSTLWQAGPLPAEVFVRLFSLQPRQLVSDLIPAVEDRQNFGIVSGVLCFTTSNGMCVLASDTLSAVSLVGDVGSSVGGAGLEEGRLPQGISRLVDEYLAKRHGAARSDLLSLAPQRDQLLSALANFAEKILFVANNGQIFSAASSGSNPFDFGGRRQIQQRRVYERLLQAIGNSVLVQVDELRHQDQQAGSDADLGPVEAQVLNDLKPPTTQPQGPLASGIDLAGMLHPATQPTPRPSELPSQGLSRRRVIDLLITKLSYEYTQAVIADGSDGEFPKRLKQALDTLYDRRAAMVYIRPPAAFLRDSYPVTSLQNSNQGPWTNELSREAARGLPFAEAGRDLIFHDQTLDAQTRQEIDKVFWQNINRIRVAGSGRTNYVMVKDDVGNWYVKGYSADPRDIIESAKEMASFAIGQPVQSDALEAALKQTNSAALQDQKQQSSQSGAQANKGKAGAARAKQSRAQATTQTTALQNFQEHEFAQVNQSYASALADLNDRIVAQARQLEDSVNLAWATHPISDPGLGEISHCAGERLKAALKPTTRPSDSADQLSDKIQANASAIKSFRDDLLKGIYPTTQPSPSNGGDTNPGPAATTAAAETGRIHRGPEVRPVMLDASPAAETTSAPASTEPATGPSHQPATSSPTTAPTTNAIGCQIHTPLSLTDQQKLDAFKIGADTIRAKLQPLLRDALASIERYQAQLNVISGK